MKNVAQLASDFDALSRAQAPKGLGDGTMGDFEEKGTGIKSKFGYGWMILTDQDFSGSSTVRTEKISPGRGQMGHALRVHGEVKPASGFTLSGAGVFLGSDPVVSVNLQTKPNLSIWGKAAANEPFQVGFISVLSPTSFVKRMKGTGSWQQIRYNIEDFDGIESTGIKGVYIGRESVGAFALTINDVRFE